MNPPTIDAGLNDNPKARGVRPSASRYALFFLPAVAGLVADLWSKAYMFSNYFDPVRADPNSSLHGPQLKVWLIDGIFGFQTSTNPGALFGIGSGYSGLFAAFSILALAGILVWLFLCNGLHDRWLTTALGLVTGGILGNLYDRLGYGFRSDFPESIQYNVRDWILFQLEGVPGFNPWPNFNIADSVLVCGAIMLFFHAVMYREPAVTDSDPA